MGPCLGKERKEGEERMEETREGKQGRRKGRGKSDRSPTIAIDLLPKRV